MSKETVVEKRDKILHDPNVRILYSTMTFFYLLGYEPGSVKSLFTLHDILSISKPSLIALPLSEKEYNEKYL